MEGSRQPSELRLWSVVEQAERVGAGDRLDLRMHVDLLDDAADVAPHGRVPDPDAFRDLTVRQPLREEGEGLALAAGQPAKQQGTLLANAFLLPSAQGERDDVGDRLQELDMVGGKSPAPHRVGAQHTEGDAVTADQHAEAALCTVLAKNRGWMETGLLGEVADHHGLVRFDRISRVRLAPGAERGAANKPGAPANAGAEQEGRTAWQQLQDRAELDAEVFRDQTHRVGEQLDIVGPSQRAVAQSGDGRLLKSARA